MTLKELSMSIAKWFGYLQATSKKYFLMIPLWRELSDMRKCMIEGRSDLLYRVNYFLIRKP